MSTPLATKQFVDDAIAAVTRNVIASSVGDVSVVANDLLEHDLIAMTLRAAKIGAGDVIRWGQWGTILNNSGGSVTATFRVYLGGTKIFDSGADSLTTNAAARSWLFEGNLFVETLQTQEAHGSHTVTGGGASGTGSMAASSVTVHGVNTGIGVDLSVDQILKVTVQFNTVSTLLSAVAAYSHASAWRA